jgi:hypothetical protein
MSHLFPLGPYSLFATSQEVVQGCFRVCLPSLLPQPVSLLDSVSTPCPISLSLAFALPSPQPQFYDRLGLP